MKKLVLLVMLLLSVALPVLAQDEMLPEQILVKSPGLFPEGIEWDAEGKRFLLSSLSQGTIFAVSDDGTITPFIEDEDLMSSVGIHIDKTTNRLLVPNSEAAVFFNPEAPGSISLGIYDLESGERLHLVNLSSLVPDVQHFANDVTADADGNAYVTDSLAGAIYRVTPDGEASIFAQNEVFQNQNFGLNGIDYHPDGYLLAAVAGAGALFKIPVDDPETVTQVELSEPLVIDGMLLNENGDLIAVANTFGGSGSMKNEIVKVSSEDDWATAQVTARVETDQSGTTAALRDDAIYVTYAQLDQMGSATPPEMFELARIDFEQ